MDNSNKRDATVCLSEETQRKRIRVQSFVDRFLSGIQNTILNPYIQAQINEQRTNLCRGQITSADAIRNSRRELGRSNEDYLQMSVMVLWSGEGADEQLLYPASATVDYNLNESTLRSMARVTEDEYNKLMLDLERTKEHLTYYISIQQIRIWIFDYMVKNEHDWHVKEMKDILYQHAEEFERPSTSPTMASSNDIDTEITKYMELIKLNTYDDVEKWRPMINAAFQEQLKLIPLFNAFAFVSDPYNDLILDGIFCVQTDILAECNTEEICDELNILSNTDLAARYKLINTDTITDQLVDGIASAETNFKSSFTYFDDNLHFLQSGPIVSAQTQTALRSSLRNTRLTEWLEYEDIKLDYTNLNEERLLQTFSVKRNLRCLSSCFLSVARGSTCSIPPHYYDATIGRDPYDPYALPAYNALQTSTNLSQPFDSTLISWSNPNRQLSEWNAVYTQTRLLVLAYDTEKGEENANSVYKKCIWTPTISKEDSATPSVGNVSINEMSLAVSYSTMLSDISNALKTNKSGASQEHYLIPAICKLEMLPSLRIINQYNSIHVQQVISSNNPLSVTNTSEVKSLEDPLLWSGQVLEDGQIYESLATGVVSKSQADLLHQHMYDTSTDNAGSITNCPRNQWNRTQRNVVINESEDSDNLRLRDGEDMKTVPEFASSEDLRGCLQLIYTWKTSNDATTNMERLKTRMEVLKESYQELLERGRRDYKGTKERVDLEERQRRSAIWSDSLRELDVSGDRFYRFLKDMAGTLHEDVTALIDLEDRSMEQNQRMYREQRRETLRQINTFSQRVMDTVISSVFRQSKLKADVVPTPSNPTTSTNSKSSTPNPNSSSSSKNDASSVDSMIDSVVVISEESIQRVKELAEGTSGLGFLEANQALQQFLWSQQASPISLRELLLGMRGVLDTYRDYAIDSLQGNQTQSGRASLEYLANPRNSYVVRIKNETFAAIRSAYLLLRRQLIDTGFSYSKLPSAYECIEGDRFEVCNQFAQLAAYQLAHSRTFSSAASVYLGATPAKLNLSMLNVSLNKTCNRVRQMYGNGRL